MTLRRIAPLFAMLLSAGLGLGQQPPAKKEPPPAPKEPPKPAPGSLEDTLEKVLRNSADIKAAEAKVREVEAELNRVRQQVLTRATAVHTDLNLARRMLAVAEQTLAVREQLHKKAAAGYDQVLEAQTLVEKHRGEVEKLETELKSLRGEFVLKNFNVTHAAFSPDGHVIWTGAADGSVRAWDPATGAALSTQPYRVDFYNPKAPAVQPSMADRVREWLNQEVTTEFEGSEIPSMVNSLLLKTKADIPVRVMLPKKEAVLVNLKGKLPVGAWLQAFEDSDPTVAIVVRDYGLLVTTKERKPTGAMSVSELWKAKPKEEKPAEKR